MNNLLDQWNEHIVRGNKLSRELEDFEGIMHVADMADSKIAISGGVGTTFIDRVLSPEKMADIKRIVITSLNEAKLTKEVELEKLMGRKPAYINPEFEAAVKEMEQQGKKQPDPVPEEKTYPEMTVELVKELYHDKNMTLDQVAKEFGVNRTALYTFITKNNLRKPSKKDIESRGITVPKKSGKERP